MVLVTKSLLSIWERLSFSEDLFTPLGNQDETHNQVMTLRVPSSTPVTIDAKLSSSRIMSAACLDTSEPVMPMAIPAKYKERPKATSLGTMATRSERWQLPVGGTLASVFHSYPHYCYLQCFIVILSISQLSSVFHRYLQYFIVIFSISQLSYSYLLVYRISPQFGCAEVEPI